MLQKSNCSEATYLPPHRDLDPSAAFYGHAARGAADVSGGTGQASFSISIPTLSGKILPLWSPRSPHDVDNRPPHGPADPPAGSSSG